MGLWVSMFIYPLVGGWVWGGGWLANLGRIAGLGNGAVDFAGSGVVHMIGGASRWPARSCLGPRIGRFNKDGSANAMPGHNIPMGVLGTIILFFGWFGFNPGSSLAFVGGGRNLAVMAAVNTLLAGAAGGVSAMLYMWLFGPTQKPDPGMSVNGILAGLVAITAPCAFVDRWAAVVIGLIGGVIVCLVTFVLERLRIDDPVGAVPVHFVNGIWGVLAVGIFANGNPVTAGWNGVATAGDRPALRRRHARSWPSSPRSARSRGRRRPVLCLLQGPQRPEAAALAAGRRADGAGHARDGRPGLHDRWT